MSFLAPLFLLLAGATAVPLLIHLLRRRSGTRVEFPAVRYLARAEREHSRRLRLRNLLLMVLRVATVLLLALAAARPMARLAGAGDGAGHAPTALAIVLDNSLSTSVIIEGRALLDRLKEVAHATLDRVSSADRVWLITADGRIAGGDADALRRVVEDVEPLFGAGDPLGALMTAANLARGAGLPAAEIAVLTDGQASTWRREVEVGDLPVAVYTPDVTPPANRAVTAVEPEPRRWTPRGAVAARIIAPDSVAYRVVLLGGDGASRTLARGIVGSAAGTPGDSGVILVRSAPPERGWVAGSVELEPDELRTDDVRHFAVWIGPPPAVAVAPGAGPFLESAVASLVDAGRLARGSDITIGPADAITRLPALLIAPSDPVRLGAANRALERLGVPWRFGSPRHTTASVRGARLDGVTASRRYELMPVGAATGDTLAVADAEPWIVGGEGYVLVASAVLPEATTLPVRAAFVPWLHDALSQRLSGIPAAVIASVPGETVSRPEWADGLEPAAADRMVPGLRLSGRDLQAPDEPGVYFLMRAGRRSGALVVNPEPGESMLRRLDRREMEQRIAARDIRVVSRADRWGSAIFASRARRPLVVPFLVAAFLTLAAESLVATGGARRAS